jgi:hypothetical protein
VVRRSRLTGPQASLWPDWRYHLLRWTPTIGLGASGQLVANTLRRRMLAIPGRLTRSARRRRLHLPRDWPWATQFLGALTRLRAILLRP